MTRVTVALLFGGRSSEHSISCATAAGVLSAIDREKYRVIPIGITRDGAMTLQPDDAELFALDAALLPEVVDNDTTVSLPESAASREWTVRDSAGSITSLGTVDIAFPILHGPFGEDGTIQGVLELMGQRYVGNGVLASAMAMNKHFTKLALQAVGIAVAPWVTLTPRRWSDDRDLWMRRVAALGLPVFVKPARAGSSVGVTRVTDLGQLESALEIAFAQDSSALVEAAVSGREIECGVLSGRDGAAPRVSVAGEIIVAGDGFYDFAAKYLDPTAAQLVCPAELGDGELGMMERIAARAFEAIDGAGLARVDFFFTGTEFIVNEVNTMPGFTPISMFPKCWSASGLAYPDLIDELIELGLSAIR